MSGSWSTDHLPNLNPQNHCVMSPCKNRYNCIAWAAGFNTQWWWPTKRYFWPQGVPREITLSAFLAAFATLRYEECQDGILEIGYEKIALFAIQDDNGLLVPTHAAKQLSDGRWTSKIGRLEDIKHNKVVDVNGPYYGTPVRFMRRVHEHING